jgi:hypothetical protein
MKGEKPQTIEAEAPILSELIRLNGEPKSGKYVSNIIFKQLSFQHIDWVRNPNEIAVHRLQLNRLAQ